VTAVAIIDSAAFGITAVCRGNAANRGHLNSCVSGGVVVGVFGFWILDLAHEP